jgi:hypothetical protein
MNAKIILVKGEAKKKILIVSVGLYVLSLLWAANIHKSH